jgi:hypothetical protein
LSHKKNLISYRSGYFTDQSGELVNGDWAGCSRYIKQKKPSETNLTGLKLNKI